MSASVDLDVSSPLSEGQSAASDHISKSSSESPCSSKINDVTAGQENKADSSEPTTPKPFPMAFTIDFGSAKPVDNRRLEELAKKSQARHQRVQSMSASLTRPAPAVQKPPMSAKLPRKAQGYNSEGYFSSDQEDSNLSGSVKLRHSPLAQSMHTTSPVVNRHIKSPIESVHSKRTSKSPIVDSIMSRSENFTSRQGLNLPIKNPTSSYSRDVHRTPSYGNLSASYQPRTLMTDIIDRSPEGVMLTDISSPELDILTPDNGLSTPEPVKSPQIRKSRASSETPDLFKKCVPKVEPLYIDDDVDQQSNNSSTGTYTIEGDNYTEEQKARMSIDRTFGANLLDEAIEDSLKKHAISTERDPELIFDFQNPRVITKEPRRDTGLRSPLSTNKTFDLPNKVSKDKNVLEISCCYESPTEHDLAAQTSKQIKSTRSYLEKIKNRVRTITEKTFPKSPPKHEEEPDMGSFTSVTTSGVLSSKNPVKVEPPIQYRRRCSLAKSEIDQTDYVHRLCRETSVPVSLPSNKLPFDDAKFESTALKNAQKAMRDDSGVSSDITPDQVVGKLSYLSLNRCKGDKTWIQDWAESVKKYNNNTLATKDELNTTFIMDGDRPPLSPRHIPGKPRSPMGGTPTKIPSPVGTLLHRRTPDLIPTQDTESYLLKTQNAITNLQAKLHSSRTNNFTNIPSQLTSSLISEKTAVSRLPISQLSRSNSLNYRLRRKETSGDSSPLRSPGHYVITGSMKVPESTRILLNSASRSLDTDRRKNHDSNMNSPCSERGLLSNSSDDKTLSNRPPYDVEAILSPHRKAHVRHKSFEGQNPNFFTDVNTNQAVCLKTVLKNNALEAGYQRIDQTRYYDNKKHQRVYSDGNKQFKPQNVGFGSSIRRSSSFNTVNKNNNYIEPPRITSRRSSGHSEEYKDYLSDESDTGSFEKSQELRYKRTSNRGRIDSPDLKSIVPANSPRCPNTPEMQRKFGPGLVRNSVRVTSKERAGSARAPEPPVQEGRPTGHQSRRVSEPRQAVLSRLTKSRSSTREFQPKQQEKGQKKPSQHRSSSALASKEASYTNWRKRASYEPMKAAMEGRRRPARDKDTSSEPSHSSPVHRSQSFHTTNTAGLQLDYSSDEEQLAALPADAMLASVHSDILDARPREHRRRQAGGSDVLLARDYVTHFQSFHTSNMAGLQLDYSSDEEQLATLPADAMLASVHSDILDARPREHRRRQAGGSDVLLARDYVTHFQSFHTTNMAGLQLDYSSDEEQLATLPADAMLASVHSDILDARPREHRRRQAGGSDVLLARDYVTHFQFRVHRSQSFHTTNMAGLQLDYSSDEEQLAALPADAMLASVHSDILDARPREHRRRQAGGSDVLLARDYVTHFQVNQPDKKRRGDADKRKTFIIDDVARDNRIDNRIDRAIDRRDGVERRRVVPDSDTNSTTNGSSPRNSSVFSQEKAELTTGTSDTEGESGPDSAPRRNHARDNANPKQRHSGDFSMSSSTTSAPRRVQPRYLDISKYSDASPKSFLRRDPSKTYVRLLPPARRQPSQETEQKKQELEKWKRRASYDPRKAAAMGKTKAPPKTASSVLRSQSFHGPVLVSTSMRYQPPPTQINETYDASSDNDF